jgi:tRNA threonylcarbamoyladenosine biosynthesis protein TsaB
VNILALESSSHHVSVALWRDGMLSQRSAELDNGGSTYLLPWASELCAEVGMELAALDAIAFGAGPGAFTGLRLACGVAQGLAFGLDLPVVPVSTLEALALAACDDGSGQVIACLDARIHEVYYAAYRIENGNVSTTLAPVCAAPFDVVLPPGDGWVGCGSGFAAYPELFAGALAVVHADRWPTAAAVARLAAPVLASGLGVDAALAVPLYLRDKVALTTAERLSRGGLK